MTQSKPRTAGIVLIVLIVALSPLIGAVIGVLLWGAS